MPVMMRGPIVCQQLYSYDERTTIVRPSYDERTIVRQL